MTKAQIRALLTASTLRIADLQGDIQLSDDAELIADNRAEIKQLRKARKNLKDMLDELDESVV